LRVIGTVDDTPMVQPFCGRCDLPVERLQFERNQGPHSWAFSGACCGVTRSARLSMQEVLRISLSGDKFFLIPRSKAGGQTFAPIPKFGVSKPKPISIWMPR
jgi:hypothetical protein